MSNENIRQLARRIRKQVVLMTSHAKSSHIGTNLSIVELLAVLYGSVMRVNPARPDWTERDRFVLSKGHGCASLYAVLAEQDFFPLDWLGSYYQDGSHLAGHITHTNVPGVDASTGSLGHGLPIACGMALVGKRENRPYRVFALLSDGECDEGSTWEAALFAPHHHLDNLVAIVDYNKIQSLGTVKEVLNLEPLKAKWDAFGWAVREIDGHDLEEIDKTLRSIPFEPERPSCIVAHTVKGKGISFMENKVLWHYRAPIGEELQQALAELEAAE